MSVTEKTNSNVPPAYAGYLLNVDGSAGSASYLHFCAASEPFRATVGDVQPSQKKKDTAQAVNGGDTTDNLLLAYSDSFST